jgi:hypothetical protein
MDADKRDRILTGIARRNSLTAKREAEEAEALEDLLQGVLQLLNGTTTILRLGDKEVLVSSRSGRTRAQPDEGTEIVRERVPKQIVAAGMPREPERDLFVGQSLYGNGRKRWSNRSQVFGPGSTGYMVKKAMVLAMGFGPDGVTLKEMTKRLNRHRRLKEPKIPVERVLTELTNLNNQERGLLCHRNPDGTFANGPVGLMYLEHFLKNPERLLGPRHRASKRRSEV